ncbi:conserved protein of unknown function [Rhodovastum atsumiense]|uniref:Uncharacterized protein n=1 Tax=Rhodovastum atsumiense TaxID=504468 RepID=A0A5M6IPU0_9PROT|nr:hypothetical protein [Rhodovastum atsumiense]KAA5610303.1 hypothetical protein F1189_20190 [Rhodovastum atsumiense]CAH2602207.1 conserved protein of unknown function [Rhodovastum atsumiense]
MTGGATPRITDDADPEQIAQVALLETTDLPAAIRWVEAKAATAVLTREKANRAKAVLRTLQAAAWGRRRG